MITVGGTGWDWPQTCRSASRGRAKRSVELRGLEPLTPTLPAENLENPRVYSTIEKIKEEDGVVTGTVIEVVEDGLILDIGLRGFLPASLVEMRRVRDLQPYVGRQLEAKIIELDKNRNNVVLSRRAWLAEQLEQTPSESEARNLLGDLRKQLADKEQELRALEARWEQENRQRKGELDELRASVDRFMREGKEARSIARRLWTAMPPEGRVAYFESESSWLPEWIVGKEE